jgi:hypothetical protein
MPADEHNMKPRALLITLILVLLAACGAPTAGEPAVVDGTPAPTTVPVPTVLPTPVPNTLVVDPGMELGPVSPYVYGSNYGPFTAVPAGKLELAIQSHVTALRFPGGEWGDVNDLQTYQLDSFLALCQQMGAIPTISVRLLNGTPAAAAELVRYANIEKGYKIRYWSIGNEPSLYDGKPNVDYDTLGFNREWRAIAMAMKAVDPAILLLGPELHGTYTSNFDTNPKDSAGRDWMTEFLKANGDMVDIVTYHRYPFPLTNASPNATINDLRQDLPEWTRTVRYLRSLIRETTGRDLPIGVTEASSHYSSALGGEGTPDSFYNAIWWADVLGRLIDEDIFIVNQWLFANSSGFSGGWGLIATAGVRPMYYTYQMYSHFGTERVYAASGVANVSIYASKRGDGTLTLMVVNLADEEQRIPLQVEGMRLSQAEAWLFDATHNAEALGQQALLTGGLLVLPPQSISLFALNK